MAIEITVPRLGWSMDEGRFSEWLKREGEWVDKGQMLFVLEGDKAAQEIESFDEGTLCLSPESPQPGDVVKVGQVIGLLLAKGESPLASKAEATAPKAIAPPAGPAVRRLARDRGVELAQINGSGPGGRILAEDVEAACAPASTAQAMHQPQTNGGAQGVEHSTKRATASPRARRAAKQLGMDWTALRGTGRGGRIRERDVQAAAASGATAEHAIERSTPLSPLRRTIAERMAASARTTAPVTLTTRADAANLLNLRRQFKAAAASPDLLAPSITDLIVKLAAASLSRHPALNSRWENDRIIEPEGVHIGIAVDTEAGLLVPVIRDVQELGVKQIAAKSKELIEKARARKLAAEEMRGGTFTITNLGSFGIDAFTPIINLPETAVLGVGAIRREPIVLPDDRIVPGDVMTLSLTFDHRAVDGARAARFLQTLVAAIEN
ncbi:MAG TPA: dihydrolipoamide acetyltransferase family protein, partial [Pirellulales bacterium]|nr:dihydrolipoamide acetyltransferase family protein [Pirellulales bacterium]